MKLRKLFGAIQRNDPTITSIDAFERSPSTITLGEALRGSKNSTTNDAAAVPTSSTFNTYVTSLSLSLEHLLSKPNTLSTIQYVYDYIRTSSALQKLEFDGDFDYVSHSDLITAPTREQCIIQFCISVAQNPKLQEVRLRDIYNAQLPLQSTIIHLLRNNTHSLKVLELDSVALLCDASLIIRENNEVDDDDDEEDEVDCEEWLELARALAAHPTLEQFKWRFDTSQADDYDSMLYCITSFIGELFELLAPNNGYTNSLHTLELYSNSIPADPIWSPGIDDALVNLVSTTTTLRHLGLSYDFGAKSTMENFLSALKIATDRTITPTKRTGSTNNNVNIIPSPSRVLSKLTFDRCSFSKESFPLLIRYYQKKAHTIVPDLCFSTLDAFEFNWYLKGNTELISKLFGGFSCLKSLDLHFNSAACFDDFFNAMYKQAVAAAVSPPTASSQQQRKRGVGFPLEYLRISFLDERQVKNMIRSLPYLVKLREFHLCGYHQVSDDPHRIVDAFRANGSLHVVTLSFQKEHLGNCVFVPKYPHHEKQIQAFSQRNKLLPELMVLLSSPSPMVVAGNDENGCSNPNLHPPAKHSVSDLNNDDARKKGGATVGIELFPSLLRSAQQSPRTGPSRLLLVLMSLGPQIRRGTTASRQHFIVANGRLSKRRRYGER